MNILYNNFYFDDYATTMCDPRVLKSMYRFCKHFYGNVNSYHKAGEKSLNIMKKFQYIIAKFLNCYSDEIIFTSGATESNNIVIRGLIEYFENKKIHIICSSYEHDSILNILKYFVKKKIIEIDYVYPDNNGIINVVEIEKLIKFNTKLVICMHVNNEIGTINDIFSIGNLCKKYNLYFHVDAAQSYGKLLIDVKKNCITSLSASGHKIYAPKGIGILYLTKRPIRIKLKPVYFGGGQQRGIKSGTVPLELCCAFVSATRICDNLMKIESIRLKSLQLYVHLEIIKNIKNIVCNGIVDSRRMYNNLNYSFYGVEGESILGLMYNFCLSTGSACNSNNLEPSSVIGKLHGEEYAHSSIRISFGRYTNKNSCDVFLKHLIKTINYLRSCSPVY